MFIKYVSACYKFCRNGATCVVLNNKQTCLCRGRNYGPTCEEIRCTLLVLLL